MFELIRLHNIVAYANVRLYTYYSSYYNSQIAIEIACRITRFVLIFFSFLSQYWQHWDEYTGPTAIKIFETVLKHSQLCDYCSCKHKQQWSNSCSRKGRISKPNIFHWSELWILEFWVTNETEEGKHKNHQRTFWAKKKSQSTESPKLFMQFRLKERAISVLCSCVMMDRGVDSMHLMSTFWPQCHRLALTRKILLKKY